jgi:hypothetical protein
VARPFATSGLLAAARPFTPGARAGAPAALGPVPGSVPAMTPVASRMRSMMSAFFVREVVFRDIACAMAWSSSRSLPSSTDRSSCCSAVIGLLISLRSAGRVGGPHGAGKTGSREGTCNERARPVTTAYGTVPLRPSGLGMRSEAPVGCTHASGSGRAGQPSGTWRTVSGRQTVSSRSAAGRQPVKDPGRPGWRGGPGRPRSGR